jgi:hypothetical protein
MWRSLNEKDPRRHPQRDLQGLERSGGRSNDEAFESFCKQLDGRDMDVLRELVKVFVERIMSEEADAICGASYGERSEPG